MKRKVALTDQYFFDNGYFTKSWDDWGRSGFEIISTTEKFKALFETCLRLTPKNQIISPETIEKVIASGNMKRTKHKSNQYKKLSQEEKDRRTNIRLEKRLARDKCQ